MTLPKYRDESDPLVHVIEERAEVIHALCKVQRFGLSDWHPADPRKTTNAELAKMEIARLEYQLERLKPCL